MRMFYYYTIAVISIKKDTKRNISKKFQDPTTFLTFFSKPVYCALVFNAKIQHPRTSDEVYFRHLTILEPRLFFSMLQAIIQHIAVQNIEAWRSLDDN